MSLSPKGIPCNGPRELPAAISASARRACSRARSNVRRDEGLRLAVVLLDALDQRLDQLHRRQLARRDQARQLGDREVVEIGCHRVCPPRAGSALSSPRADPAPLMGRRQGRAAKTPEFATLRCVAAVTPTNVPRARGRWRRCGRPGRRPCAFSLIPSLGSPSVSPALPAKIAALHSSRTLTRQRPASASPRRRQLKRFGATSRCGWGVERGAQAVRRPWIETDYPLICPEDS